MECRDYTDLQEAGNIYMQVYIVSGSNCIVYYVVASCSIQKGLKIFHLQQCCQSERSFC